MSSTGAKACIALFGVWTAIFPAWSWATEPTPAIMGSISAESPALCRCIDEFGASSARIKALLAAPLKSSGLEFKEEPLEDVVNFLREEYDIPIQIDEPELEDAGLTRDEPVTVVARDISLESALRLMLKVKGLTYAIQNETLILTTRDADESQRTTCVYDVRDIVAALPKPKSPAGAAAWADYDPLIGVITECVCPDTWKETGSEGDVRSIAPGVLVIYQTQHVHRQVTNLLNAIRQTLKQPFERFPNIEIVGAEGTMIDVGVGGGGGGYGGDPGGNGMKGSGEKGMPAAPTPADEDPFAE
jgi:hypothetical protein